MTQQALVIASQKKISFLKQSHNKADNYNQINLESILLETIYEHVNIIRRNCCPR